MLAEDFKGSTSKGFEGAVTGLTLPDVIQMNGHNRFTGCITVEHGQRSGSIFFRDGEVIHAEQGEKTGTGAFYEIMYWPGGKFSLQPKVTTTSNTIKENLNFLLLEAYRLMDEYQENARNEAAADAGKVAASGGGSPMSAIAAKLKQVPGIVQAVLLGKDGTPVEDESFEAENLSAQAVYLAMFGNQLGDVFGLGDMKSAAVQGKNQHLLLFESKQHYLSVAVTGDAQIGAVEAEIRKVLTPKK